MDQERILMDYIVLVIIGIIASDYGTFSKENINFKKEVKAAYQSHFKIDCVGIIFSRGKYSIL